MSERAQADLGEWNEVKAGGSQADKGRQDSRRNWDGGRDKQAAPGSKKNPKGKQRYQSASGTRMMKFSSRGQEGKKDEKQMSAKDEPKVQEKQPSKASDGNNLWNFLYTDKMPGILEKMDEKKSKASTLNRSQSTQQTIRSHDKTKLKEATSDKPAQPQLAEPANSKVEPQAQAEPTEKSLHSVTKSLSQLLQSNTMASRDIKKMSTEEVDQMVEGNEFIEQFKSIPKKFRARLTRKQMLMMGKEFTMAETVNITFQEDKKVKKKGTILTGEEKEIEMKKERKQRVIGASNDSAGLGSRSQREPFQNRASGPQQQQAAIFDQFGERKKQKPSQIMLITRDEVTNEIVKTLIDKKKRKKVTALKKLIWESRRLRKERKEIMQKQKRSIKKQDKHGQDPNESQYETIYETDCKNEDDQSDEEVQDEKVNEQDMLARRRAQLYDDPEPPAIYQPFFSSFLNSPVEHKKFTKNLKKDIFGQKLKIVQKTAGLDGPDSESKQELKLWSDSDEEETPKRNNKPIDFNNLHMQSNQQKKRCKIREYVDMHQSDELGEAVRSLLYKLKELYFIRKTKPQKGKYKKAMQVPKKRYLIGLKEIMKHLKLQKLAMIIVAINIEQDEQEADDINGLNHYILTIVKECRMYQKIPLVFCLTRNQLGTVTKFKGQQASVVGIENFQGANSEFNSLVEIAQKNREIFYEQVKQNTAKDKIDDLIEHNKFLDANLLKFGAAKW